jgi:LemA protein
MKKSTLIVISGILILFLFFFQYYRSTFDNAVKLQETVDEQWGNVAATYQRRADLVPNLVATVKGAAEVETEILTRVTEARAGIVGAKTPEDLDRAGRQINTAINLAFEAYPQIRSTEGFRDLQAQLEGTENRINVARQNYNVAVKGYNTHVRGFIQRRLLDEEFEIRKTFENTAGAEVAPDVQSQLKRD